MKRNVKMYDALSIARYVVKKCINEHEPISNLQLQKILYVIQRVYLQSGKSLFVDEIES